ncbi:hypothetical protein FRC03_002109 [Tulasnella sp. 419]|nr:hypothetical protein FRC03_002109 [Tulasnella sp. 419]
MAYEVAKVYCASRSYHRRTRWEITGAHRKALEGGDFAVDQAMDRYFENGVGLLDELLVSPIQFFANIESNPGCFSSSMMELLEPGVVPYKYPFVAFPINCSNAHWILAILAYPSVPEKRAILLFDSNGDDGYHPRHAGLLRLFLMEMAMAAGHPKDLDSIKCFFTVPVYDVLATEIKRLWAVSSPLLTVFMKCPEDYYDHCTGKQPFDVALEVIWEEHEAKQLRDEQIDIINDLSHLYKQIDNWREFLRNRLAVSLSSSYDKP